MWCAMTWAEIRPGASEPTAAVAPELPASKSHAQRAMLLAAGGGRVTLGGAAAGDDVDVLAAALRQMGVACAWDGADLTIERGEAAAGPVRVHLGENGTALRILPFCAAAWGCQLRIDGDPGLYRRPLDEVRDALAQLGIELRAAELPLEIDARAARWPGSIRVDAARTTQPASGAMLALGLRARRGLGGGTVEAHRPAAWGYLEITAEVLRAFGHEVRVEVTPDARRYQVADAVQPTPRRYDVPRDASSALFVAAWRAMHGVPDAVDATLGGEHPDREGVADVARIASAAPGVEVVLEGLGARPDSAPAVAAVAAVRPGVTRLADVPALRHKESDRLQALVDALRAVGAGGCIEGDDLVVEGPIAEHAGLVEVPVPADHRMVMASALWGTVLPHGVRVPHSAAVAKSWPGFFAWLGRVARVELRAP